MGWAALGHPMGIAGKAPQEALESTWRMRTLKKFRLGSTADPIQKKKFLKTFTWQQPNACKPKDENWRTTGF